MNLVRSLRFRITALSMVFVFAALAGLGIFVVRAVEDHVVRQVDQDLTANAQYIRYRIFHHEFVPRDMPVGQFGAVYTPTGRQLGHSASLDGHRPIVRFVPPGVSAPRLLTVNDPRLGAVRVLEFPLGGDPPLTLVAGQQVNQAMAVTTTLSDTLWLVLPLLGLLLAVLIWNVVGRAMRRVEAIRSSVAHISTNKLDSRVALSGTGDELDQLVTTMNEMLDRLKRSVDREHRFIADASHELRSPIAALRAALTGPRGSTEVDCRVDTSLSSLQRLELLAEELLTLECLGTEGIREARRIDLDDLILCQAMQLRSSSNVTIDISEVSGGQVIASEADMARIIENLSSNAIRYAQSEVRFGVTEEHDVVRLTVTDDGPGIPEDLRLKVFERFFRIAADRDRNSGGTGLGLSIAADLVHHWGGRIEVISNDPSGARFIVEFPRASKGSDAALGSLVRSGQPGGDGDDATDALRFVGMTEK